MILEVIKKQTKKAEKFLQKDYSDSNMLVAVRIRPLSQREIGLNDKDIIRSEDKLLVALLILIMIDCT